MNKPNKKPVVHAFIDSQNLNLGTQKMGWKLDWSKFRRFLNDKYGVTKAYLFIGYLPEYEAMYNQLHELGYLIVLKPTVGMNNEQKLQAIEPEAKSDPKTGDPTPEDRKSPVKGNIDAELVLYAMKELKNYDKAMIVSGDGDFYCLVEYLVEQNKLLHLVAPNWQYSSLLKPYESYIVRLDKERRNLAYRDHRKTKEHRQKV